MPSLLGSGGEAPGDWRDCVDAVCRCLGGLSAPVVLVGHSGGGMLLPVIADALAQPVRGLIFVDSGIPASTGETPFVPPALLAEFGALAVDGILPPWSSWFGEAAMREELPDESLRQAVVGELPSIPFSLLEQRIPSPPGWERTACRYLLLSEGYKESATEAQDRGWPIEVIERARHLHITVAPGVVTDALLRLEP